MFKTLSEDLKFLTYVFGNPVLCLVLAHCHCSSLTGTKCNKTDNSTEYLVFRGFYSLHSENLLLVQCFLPCPHQRVKGSSTCR